MKSDHDTMTGRRRGAVRAARGAAAAVAALAVATAASASASPTSAAATASAARLSAVSCLSTKWCMAVGSYTTKAHGTHSLAQVWTKGKWHRLPDPPGTGLRTMSTLTCASRSFCLATSGFPGDQFYQAAFWNGATWKTMPGPKHEGSPPSCASPAVCMTINHSSIKGSNAMVQAWFGRGWQSLPGQTGVCLAQDTPCGLLDVSCGSTANCVAVGYTTPGGNGVIRSAAAVWNGKSWKITQPPEGHSIEAKTSAVSCAGTFCMAVGCCTAPADSLIIATYSATTGSWASRSSGEKAPSFCGAQCFLPGSLSCGSATNCMEFASYGNLAWNGRKFRPAPSVKAGRGSDLSAVSCGKFYCLAVGHRTVNGVVKTLAELWNGTSWKLLATPDVT